MVIRAHLLVHLGCFLTGLGIMSVVPSSCAHKSGTVTIVISTVIHDTVNRFITLEKENTN